MYRKGIDYTLKYKDGSDVEDDLYKIEDHYSFDIHKHIPRLEMKYSQHLESAIIIFYKPIHISIKYCSQSIITVPDYSCVEVGGYNNIITGDNCYIKSSEGCTIFTRQYCEIDCGYYCNLSIITKTKFDVSDKCSIFNRCNSETYITKSGKRLIGESGYYGRSGYRNITNESGIIYKIKKFLKLVK